MKLFQSLKRVAHLLNEHETPWAICGGVAACLYRETPRYTGDIDIALCGESADSAASLASDLLASLGYEPIRGFVTDQNGKLIKGVALLLGREDDEGSYLGIDFLLPVLPWIPAAVERAQSNKLDYGFASLPTILPEDLILAKLFAVSGNPDRKYDLDDIESILHHMKDLDTTQILTQAKAMKLVIPVSIQDLLAL